VRSSDGQGPAFSFRIVAEEDSNKQGVTDAP